MKSKFDKKISSREWLGIIANASTIGAFILALIALVYSQNNPSSDSSGIGTVAIVFIIISGLLTILLAIITIKRFIGLRTSKTRQLTQKFSEYRSTNPQYLKNITVAKFDVLEEKAIKAIKKLDKDSSFDEDIYYLMLYSLFNSADGDINVVSILDDKEWVDTKEEDEFLRINLQMVNNRRQLNRIFVVDKNNAGSKLNKKSIIEFIKANHTYIHIFIVYKEDLKKAVLDSIGGGFIEFYNFAVACDVFSDNEIRGKIVFENAEVDRYRRLYFSLMEFYQPLNEKLANELGLKI